MDIYVIANWTTGFFEAYYLYKLCETFMERREACNKYIYIAGVICLGILVNISNALFSITLLNIAATVFMGYVFSFLFKGSQKRQITLPMLAYMISTLMEMLTLFLLSFILNQSIENIIAEGYPRLIGILLSKMLGYAAIKLISFKFNKKIVRADINYWILFVIMFCVTTVTLFTFCKVLEETYTLYIRNLMISCMFGLSIASIIVMILYENTLKQKYIINQNQISEVKLKEQIKHYNDIMMTQGQVKKLRHDLENHLLSIQAMVQKEEYDKCLEYIDTLIKNIDVSNSYLDTGNTVLDAIISAKKTEAEKQGVEFNLKIRIPALLPISQEDECIIFGNALDNAIEAASKAPGKKYVNLSLVLDKETLVCNISNSCKDITNSITTKDDLKNHGIGKYNIAEILKKYNSLSRITYENNEYILSIIFMGLYGKNK